MLSLAAPAGVAAIYGMSVRPEARGKGVASAFTNIAIERAQSVGCTRVVLHSSEMAIGVYERAGFTKQCEMTVYANAPVWRTVRREGVRARLDMCSHPTLVLPGHRLTFGVATPVARVLHGESGRGDRKPAAPVRWLLSTGELQPPVVCASASASDSPFGASRSRDGEVARHLLTRHAVHGLG